MHISIPFVPFLLIGCIIVLIILLVTNGQNNKNNDNKKSNNDFIDQGSKELNNMVNTFVDVGKQAIDATSNVINNVTNKQYCTNCGTKIDKDSKYCKNCGKEI